MKPLQIEGSFDLLICDCDGVIVDSEIVCERILAVALEEAYRGHDLAPVLAGSFGLFHNFASNLHKVTLAA